MMGYFSVKSKGNLNVFLLFFPTYITCIIPVKFEIYFLGLP